MSVIWTPLRLTMSSSPQISRQDGISNSLPSFSKINTSGVGASASVSASASASTSTSVSSAYKFPAQEETVLQKETVRISPPLHQKEIPVSPYHTNGHVRNSRIESHTYNLKIRNSPSFDENKVINKNEWRTYRRFNCVDRECQTDDIRYCEIYSSNMANDDYEMETVGNRPNLYPEIHQQNNGTENDHLPSKSDNFSSRPDTESKDRDLEDIDVIVPLNKERSESDHTDFISEQPRLNGSAMSNDNIKVYEKQDNSKKRNDWSNKNEEEEEKDTCCTSCLLLTLNICDCVIL